MKAARFYDKGDIRVESIPDPPPPTEDEVQIDVHWAGICGSDLHEYIAGPMVINTPDRCHPLTNAHLPITMGHEFCGRIRDPGRSELKVGQAVMVDPRINCGTCVNCSEGNDHMCESWGFIGLNGGAGGGAGFSEQVNVKTRMVYPLAEGVDLNSAAIIEPLVVARHALSASGVGSFEDKNVLVVGGGPVGIAVLYNLKAKGVGRVFVSEPTAKRNEMVKELGLLRQGDVFNPLLVSVPQKCKEGTNGRGVDVVFDCAGIDKGLITGMESLKNSGIYVNVAGWETPFVVPLMHAMLKEITIKYSMAYDSKDFKEVVEEFGTGKFAGAEKMITGRIGLDSVTAKGFDELVTKKDAHVKILVTPRTELQAY